jgi:hypothetical protein
MARRHCLLPLLLLFFQHQAFAHASTEMNEQIASNRAVREVALSPDGWT